MLVLSQHPFRLAKGLFLSLQQNVCFLKHPLPSNAHYTLQCNFQIYIGYTVKLIANTLFGHYRAYLVHLKHLYNYLRAPLYVH